MATGPLLPPAQRTKITSEQIQMLQDADPSNYIIIDLSWTLRFVLPFVDGIAFISALQKMEKIEEGLIFPIEDGDKPNFQLISKERYIEMKMKYLLEGKPNEETISV